MAQEWGTLRRYVQVDLWVSGLAAKGEFRVLP